MDHTDEINLTFNSYAEWESKGGKELKIGANRLTNQQLFWVALARSRYVKLRGVPYEDNYKKTIFLYEEALYELNHFKSIKKSFKCSVEAENEFATMIGDLCKPDIPFDPPLNNRFLEKFRNTIQFFGL